MKYHIIDDFSIVGSMAIATFIIAVIVFSLSIRNVKKTVRKNATISPNWVDWEGEKSETISSSSVPYVKISYSEKFLALLLVWLQIILVVCFLLFWLNYSPEMNPVGPLLFILTIIFPWIYSFAKEKLLDAFFAESKVVGGDSTKIKKSRWMAGIGILLVLFGSLDVIGGAKKITFPFALEMIEDSFSSFLDNQKQPKDKKSRKLKNMRKMFEFPKWYQSWGTTINIISVIIAALYLLSGIFFLLTKKFANKMFYFVITSSIIWTIVQMTLFYYKGNTFVMVGQGIELLVKVAIDILFLTIILLDRKVFLLSNERVK